MQQILEYVLFKSHFDSFQFCYFQHKNFFRRQLDLLSPCDTQRNVKVNLIEFPEHLQTEEEKFRLSRLMLKMIFEVATREWKVLSTQKNIKLSCKLTLLSFNLVLVFSGFWIAWEGDMKRKQFERMLALTV